MNTDTTTSPEMTKTWKLQYSKAAWERIEAEAQAIAEEYRSGRKIRRWESPQMIALHGRAPWPAEDAAKEAYEVWILQATVAEKYPTCHLHAHYRRKFERKS